MAIKDKLKQNKGMTLMELLVTIAIIAIATAIGVTSLSIIASGDSKKACKSIQDNLNEAKTNTLSISGLWEAHITRNSDGSLQTSVYMGETVETTNPDGTKDTTVVWKERDKVELGKRIEVFYSCDGTEAGAKEIEKGHEIVISFEKSTGKVNEVTYRTKGSESGTDLMAITTGSSFQIFTDSTSKGRYAINIWYQTGKITGTE